VSCRYYDDLELSLTKDSTCLVRSASRTGYLDFQVNAKRLNYFANALNKKGGWKCPLVTADKYPRYFKENPE
jgi:hypothetical protein